MIREKSLVVYKNRPALVTGVDEKLSISVYGGESLRVREKDVVFLHPGPLSGFSAGEEVWGAGPSAGVNAREIWELLEGGSSTLEEIAGLGWGSFSPESAWGAWKLLREGRFFSGTAEAVRPLPAEEVLEAAGKREAKEKEARERAAFLARLSARRLELPGDERFAQDVEALALGKSERSRTLRDAGIPEEPAAAHRLLLDCGLWSEARNPWPSRNGCALFPPASPVSPPPEDDVRRDLRGLAAFAIDSPWSNDPDDALSVEEGANGSLSLFVHVADPAASIAPDSEADQEARNRGATLYLPEGVVRMLPEATLDYYALGLAETSPALTFALTLTEEGEIQGVEVFRSTVSVTRLTYAQADAALEGRGDSLAACEALRLLDGLSRRNEERRARAGAVFIEFPEVHLSVHLAEGEEAAIRFEPVPAYRSAGIVRECMLLAGEAAAHWALSRRLPFPYVSQETGDLPKNPPPGYAGAYLCRKAMRPRILSAKPGLHWGLGLDIYTQVTSPLRRYTDLLAHQQISAALRSLPPLVEDELLARLAQAEQGALATVHAERASRLHWTACYLSRLARAGEKPLTFDAVLLEQKGPHGVFLLPALAQETTTALPRGKLFLPGESHPLTFARARIPEAEITWKCAAEPETAEPPGAML